MSEIIFQQNVDPLENVDTEKTAILLVGLFKPFTGHFPYQDLFTTCKTSYINNLIQYKKKVVIPNDADVFMFIDYDDVILTRENKSVVISNIKKIFGRHLKEIVIYSDNYDYYTELFMDFREQIFKNFKNNFDSINFTYTDDDIRNSHLFLTSNTYFFYKLYIANIIKCKYEQNHNVNYKYLLSDRLDSTTYYKEIILKDIVDNLLQVNEKVICGSWSSFAGLNSEVSKFFYALRDIGKYLIIKESLEEVVSKRPSYICGYAESVTTELVKYTSNCEFHHMLYSYIWPHNFCGQRSSKLNFGIDLYSTEDWDFLTKEISQNDFEASHVDMDS